MSLFHSHGFLRDVRFLVHFSDETDELKVNGPSTSNSDEPQPNEDDISSNDSISKDGSDEDTDSEAKESNTDKMNESTVKVVHNNHTVDKTASLTKKHVETISNKSVEIIVKKKASNAAEKSDIKAKKKITISPKHAAKHKSKKRELISEDLTNVSPDVITKSALSKNGSDSDSETEEVNTKKMNVSTEKVVHTNNTTDSKGLLPGGNGESMSNEATESLVDNQTFKTVETRKRNGAKQFNTKATKQNEKLPKRGSKSKKGKYKLMSADSTNDPSAVSADSQNVDENEETEPNEVTQALNNIQKVNTPTLKRRGKNDLKEKVQNPDLAKTNAQPESGVLMLSSEPSAKSITNKTSPPKTIKTSTKNEKTVKHVSFDVRNISNGRTISGLEKFNNHQKNKVNIDYIRPIRMNSDIEETGTIQVSEAGNNIQTAIKRKRKQRTEESEETVNKPKMAKTNDQPKSDNLISSQAMSAQSVPNKKHLTAIESTKTPTKTALKSPAKTPTKTPTKINLNVPMYQSVPVPSSSQLIIRKLNSSQNDQAAVTKTITMAGQQPLILLPRVIEE